MPKKHETEKYLLTNRQTHWDVKKIDQQIALNINHGYLNLSVFFNAHISISNIKLYKYGQPFLEKDGIQMHPHTTVFTVTVKGFLRRSLVQTWEGKLEK